jgi:hypothetical protein
VNFGFRILDCEIDKIHERRTEKIMPDTVNPKSKTDDKGPTEKLRDDAKSDAGELVTAEAGVPGAQKPDNEDIKDETNPNTE